MERWKRLIYYLLINVAVSACTILSILFVYERINQPEILTPPPVAQVIPATATPPETIVETAEGSTGGIPESAPTATLEPTGSQTYTVRAGDTLGAIATAFGVTVEEIMAANNMENPNVLNVGDVLIIPVPAAESEPTPIAALPTNTLPSPSTSNLGTNTPLPPDFNPQIQIVTVVAAGNLADERVVIRLNGEGELVLRNWSLKDEDGNVYTFPELTLYKDGAVTVYTKGGTNNVVELFWGFDKAVWEPGEKVSLLDPEGNERASYNIP